MTVGVLNQILSSYWKGCLCNMAFTPTFLFSNIILNIILTFLLISLHTKYHYSDLKSCFNNIKTISFSPPKSHHQVKSNDIPWWAVFRRDPYFTLSPASPQHFLLVISKDSVEIEQRVTPLSSSPKGKTTRYVRTIGLPCLLFLHLWIQSQIKNNKMLNTYRPFLAFIPITIHNRNYLQNT